MHELNYEHFCLLLSFSWKANNKFINGEWMSNYYWYFWNYTAIIWNFNGVVLKQNFYTSDKLKGAPKIFYITKYEIIKISSITPNGKSNSSKKNIYFFLQLLIPRPPRTMKKITKYLIEDKLPFPIFITFQLTLKSKKVVTII